MDLNKLTLAEWLGIFGFLGSFATIVIAGYVQLKKLRGENKVNIAGAKKDEADANLTNVKTAGEILDLYERLRKLDDQLIEEKIKREDLRALMDREKDDRIQERQIFEMAIQAEKNARVRLEIEIKLLRDWAERLVAQIEDIGGIKPAPYINESAPTT